MRPRLSIIVATYNACETLERCLQSVFEQSFSDWELLIADGGSTDGTQQLIRAHADKLAWWQSKPDNGIYDAWNQAISHAHGEYVSFLGADDAWHTTHTLADIFGALGSEPYDLVTGRGALINAGGVRYHTFGSGWNFHKVARRITICHPGAFHRRDLFERYGPFDTSYRICADYDFLLRLPAETKALYLDFPWVDVADAGVSRSRRGLMLREKYRAQARCSRIGKVRAAINYADKLWRIPVARILGIPN